MQMLLETADFLPQNLSNTVWSFEILTYKADRVLVESAAAQLLRVAEKGRGMNLVDFYSALPASSSPVSTATAQLRDHVEDTLLNPLIRGIRAGVCMDGTQDMVHSELQAAVDRALVPHLGPFLSKQLLEALGIACFSACCQQP